MRVGMGRGTDALALKQKKEELRNPGKKNLETPQHSGTTVTTSNETLQAKQLLRPHWSESYQLDPVRVNMNNYYYYC